MARCISCGRLLTNQESINIGIGSECRRKAKKSGTLGKRGNNWRRRVERTIGFSRGEISVGDCTYKLIGGKWTDEYFSFGQDAMEKFLLYHGQIIRPNEVTDEMYDLLKSGKTLEDILAEKLDKNEEL